MAAPLVLSRVFNLRVTPELWDMITTASRQSGLPRSEWVREALEGVARQELDPPAPRPTLRPASPRTFVAQSNGACQHPPTARILGVFADQCAVCGTELDKAITS